jgi:hypothetical protein
VVQELLSAGGDVNAMGERGNRPLHLAAAAGHTEVGTGWVTTHGILAAAQQQEVHRNGEQEGELFSGQQQQQEEEVYVWVALYTPPPIYTV